MYTYGMTLAIGALCGISRKQKGLCLELIFT